SGSGKTTLALTLMRLLPPGARIAGGSVRFDGEDIFTKSDSEMRAIRGKRMAMILQDPMASLNPLFTVGGQIPETLRQHHQLRIVAKMCDDVAVMYAGRLVEFGPVRRIFDAPAHPYTRALIESIPRLGDPTARLTAIDGQPPDPAALPPGCAFHPRCPLVVDRCRVEAPAEVRLAVAHHARCWLASERPL